MQLVKNHMGYTTPTEIQSKAIPHILKQQDIIVRSKTGSGKTAVFGVSILQLTDPEAPGPQSLILTSTRELAVQVDNDLKLLSKHLRHRTTAVYGKHSMALEIQAINQGLSIITGTPGRVYDHILNGSLDTRNIRFLVLDEADRMLDMGFIDQVEKIIWTLPRDRVTLLFSATIPPEIGNICVKYMKDPLTIEIESPTKTVDTVSQCYYRAEEKKKLECLNRLLLYMRPESCMVFCNTRLAADRVARYLKRKGYAAQALHGDIPQGRRLATMQQFKEGGFQLLVATDVAARGIHVEGLSLVVNYDVPNDRDSYIHRIGRTGRAGQMGQAVSLVTRDDIMTLYEIEEHIGVLIEEAEWPDESELVIHAGEVEQWIKSHALSDKAAEDAGKPAEKRRHSRKAGRKSSRSKTSREKAGKAKGRGKTGKGEHTAASAGFMTGNKAAGRQPSDRKSGGRINIVYSKNNGKPIFVAAKPSIISTVENTGAGRGSPKSPVGKSFFERLFSRLKKEV
ncbi:MAG: DEAD/DEAH box helicase [Clostridiaceae bacterium]|jgi:ATP-dependent RNA helicase DeaD|nr:DEAD/DEAH box helicase [Clostridiaceae bacterium]